MSHQIKTYFFGCDSTCKNGECQNWHNGPCRHLIGDNISTSKPDSSTKDKPK